MNEFNRIRKKAKCASIGNIRELLGFDKLRAYIKTNLIDNNRLKIQVLEDPFLNCRTKLGILEAYKRFEMGLDNPNSLKRWH